jgi:transcriptional regulator with XRE-family HTH domain
MAVEERLEDVSSRIARTLRAHRRARELSIGELAKRAGLSKTLISRLEAGAGNPSVETLWRLANALDVPLGMLIENDEPPRTRLIEPDEGPIVVSEGGFLGRLILAEGRDHRTEVYELRIAPDVDYRSEAHAPGTEELVVCVSGSVEVGPDGQEVVLSPGGALWFPADLPHRYRAEHESRALLVMSYPPTAVRQPAGPAGRDESGPWAAGRRDELSVHPPASPTTSK